MTVQKRAAILLLSVALLLGMVACGQGNAADVPSTPSMLSVPGTLQSELLSTEHSDLPFADVPSDAEYAQAVAWCREQGLMGGVGGNRFDPNGTLTRAMVVTVLYRAEQTPQVEWKDTFSDVPAGQWYSDAITWASANGIVGGYGNGLFGTNDPITREQLDVGVLYSRSRWQCVIALYRSLLIAMVGGRLVWAAVRVIMTGVTSVPFTWEIFLADAFLSAIPGIILQLVFIPALMVALNRTGLVRFHRETVSTAG